jgi:hypothetical protein
LSFELSYHSDVELALAILFLLGLIALVVVAERSLRRQAGSGIKRSREERLALGNLETNSARGAGGQGF